MFSICIFIFFISYIVGWIFLIKQKLPSIISNIKCKNVKGCLDENCPLRPHCNHTAYTDNEKKALYQKIKNL